MGDSPLGRVVDSRRALKEGAAGIEQRQRARLAEMVGFARANSPYYRELYEGLPERVDDPAVLPVTTKKELMARFDDWTTDRDVTLEEARVLVEEPSLFGKRLLDKYLVITTSGTTGTRGIFLVDEPTLSVVAPLFLRMLSSWLTSRDTARIIARGGRVASILAPGTPTVTGVSIVRLQRRLGKRFLSCSVHTPLSELIAELNQFQPALLISYATVIKLLADEQEAGRLHIDPVLAVMSGEGLVLSEYDRIARSLGAKVGNSYAASECPFMSYSCTQGWLHVNADWVVLEPVDADYRQTPLGEQSHTVLISNLANRVQPILRYDLGDNVVQRPDPCPCGNPLPAIRVQGRAADVVTFPSESGERVTVPPLLFGTTISDIPGIEQFQVVQTAPTALTVRLALGDGAEPDVIWRNVKDRITGTLAERGLGHVTLERAAQAPERSPGGKYREVIPLNRNLTTDESGRQ